MKKINLFVCICAAFVVFVNASVWEGAAAVAAGGELPESGLYMATNSFPVNTVVDVTNLDNGKTVRVTAVKGLESPGLLALLSKEAGSALDLQGQTPGRIRVSQATDPAALSRLAAGRNTSGDPDFDPAALAAQNGYDSNSAGTDQNSPAADTLADTIKAETAEPIVDLPDDTQPAMAPAPVQPAVAEAAAVQPDAPQPAVVQSVPAASSTAPAEPAVQPPGVQNAELILAPAENRPPDAGPKPDSAYIIPEISSAPASPLVSPPAALSPLVPQDSTSVYMDPSLFIDPIKTTNAKDVAESATQPVAQSDSYPVQIFTAPLITDLEKGSYYLQIAAFSKEESVRSVLSTMDNNLPLAIMNAGSAEKPVYRVLIGPVNLGESGALLRRFKSSYKDAFVRLGGK